MAPAKNILFYSVAVASGIVMGICGYALRHDQLIFGESPQVACGIVILCAAVVLFCESLRLHRMKETAVGVVMMSVLGLLFLIMGFWRLD